MNERTWRVMGWPRPDTVRIGSCALAGRTTLAAVRVRDHARTRVRLTAALGDWRDSTGSRTPRWNPHITLVQIKV